MAKTRPTEICASKSYGMTDAAYLLEMDRKTLDKYAQLGKRHGGLDCYVSRVNLRRKFKGTELLRFKSMM